MTGKYLHRSFSFILLLLVASTIILVAKPVYAQPAPPDVPTLGPITYFYTDYTGKNIDIFSPQNGVKCSNDVQLSFSIKVVGCFGQFGNVGYSIDGGVVTSIRNFTDKTVNQTGVYDWYWWTTTASAKVVLPKLNGGVHNVTVYYGWQYLGVPQNPSLERFEVSTLKTVEFTVEGTPPPNPPAITQLSIVNQTYNNTSVPLSFCVDGETSWIAYNLDNKGNITIEGNTTLTGLTSGFHNIVVFANDTLGNMGKTDIVAFEVEKEVPPAVIDLRIIVVALTVIGVGASAVVCFTKYYRSKSIRTVASFVRRYRHSTLKKEGYK